MAYTVPVDGAPVAVTLATTCTLVTTDGSAAAETAQWALISSDTVGSTDIVRVVYGSTADGGSLPATGYHEIPANRLPAYVPIRGRRFLLQGSSAFAVQLELMG